MLNKFLKDPNYLLRYFIYNLILFIIINISLIYFDFSLTHFDFKAISLLLIPISATLGLISATAFHNASHGNIKPRFLNSIIGELTANLSLEDIRCFTVGHMLHHKHTDDPELDPHPPAGMSFYEFIRDSRNNTIRVISNAYFKKHGSSITSKNNVKSQIIIFHFLALSKLIFWFLLFGLNGFLLIYLPSYLAYFFGFAHLNYISHQPNRDGGSEVSNRDGGLFYGFMNIVTSGGYYHKNHHLYPSYYNPSKAGKKKENRSLLMDISILGNELK